MSTKKTTKYLSKNSNAKVNAHDEYKELKGYSLKLTWVIICHLFGIHDPFFQAVCGILWYLIFQQGYQFLTKIVLYQSEIVKLFVINPLFFNSWSQLTDFWKVSTLGYYETVNPIIIKWGWFSKLFMTYYVPCPAICLLHRNDSVSPPCVVSSCAILFSHGWQSEI